MKRLLFLSFVLLSLPLFSQQVNKLKLTDIPIRDPYILTVDEEKTYYLYAATREETKIKSGLPGVCAYKSNDLKTWQGPFHVFENPDGFWAGSSHGIWAPEVHRYNGKYYLFATFTNPDDTIETRSDGIPVVLRGTQIMVADNPLGPFKPFDLKRPVTPENWSALDGTLWVEEGKPYMVFCHEWVQINEGTFEVADLNSDLSGLSGTPKTIFKVNDAPWVKRTDLLGIKYKGLEIPGFVSDGPFILRLPSGKLICLTSSFGENQYSLSYAVSISGKLAGPWQHPSKPLLSGGHGHGMLFNSFDGKLLLVCHFPNSSPSKAVIYEVGELEAGISIIKAYQ
jgi:beta-xylosidase